jgi:shikimate kinase
MRRHVFLVGARASGKTSAARGLASALGLGWTDTDARIQELLGESIAALVEREGWDAFRHRESAALRAVLEEEPMVVACGGGIVLREENRRMLARGLTLYLRAPAEVLAARLAGDPLAGQRPSLTGRTIAEEVAGVLTEREPLYQGVADAAIDAALPLDEVVAACAAAVKDTDK